MESSFPQARCTSRPGDAERLGDGTQLHHEPVWLTRQRFEIVMLVEGLGTAIDRVDHHHTPSCASCCYDDDLKGNDEERRSHPLALHRGVQRKLRKENRWDLLRRSPYQRTRCIVAFQEVGCDGEVAHDRVPIVNEHVRPGSLTCCRRRVVTKPVIEILVPAREPTDVVTSKRLDVSVHCCEMCASRRARLAALARRGAAAGSSSAVTS